MKNRILYIIYSLVTLTFIGCSDGEDNKPSMSDSDRMEVLLDKNNEKAVDFRDQYGTYLLYKFDNLKDFAYLFEEAPAWRNATIEKIDESDFDGAIDFIQDEFFSKYSDDVKRKLFPRKILFVNSINASILGLSIPNSSGYHMATASINSLSIANLSASQLSLMNEEEKELFVKQIHYIYLAGYVVAARSNYFVNESFFDYCKTLYNSLISSDRKPASKFDDSYFFEKGLFRPNNTDTYFESAGEDLQQYIKKVIFMNVSDVEIYNQYPILKTKLLLLIEGLKKLGVDIDDINPVVTQLN